MENTADSTITNILEKIRPLVGSLSPEERLALIQAIASTPASDSGENSLAREQAAWFARPKSDRQRYAGEYVAVYADKVVDHDADQRALYLRVRARFTNQPVLIVHADWDEPPTITIHSPHFER